MPVSLSSERRWLCQPRQLSSTFCCDRGFSVIDPNYRSQPQQLLGLQTRLPKPTRNEGQGLRLRAAGTVVDADSGAASLGEPGTYRDLCAPHVTSRGPPSTALSTHTLAGAAHGLLTAFPSILITCTATSQKQKTSTRVLRSTADPTAPSTVGSSSNQCPPLCSGHGEGCGNSHSTGGKPSLAMLPTV